MSASTLAADSARLSSLAAASGYTYQWLASETGVTLQRPGVVIVLHAGYPLYEVNSTPAQADNAPRYDRGDLVVSPELAKRLRQIAIAHPLLIPSPTAPTAQIPDPTSPGTSPSGTLTITARQIPGREALAFRGSAPANVPITITVTGEPSVDLPSVILNRMIVMSGADGSYSAVTSIGQDPHRGTSIAVTATSLTVLASATARIVVDAPNPSVVNSNLDQFPPK